VRASGGTVRRDHGRDGCADLYGGVWDRRHNCRFAALFVGCGHDGLMIDVWAETRNRRIGLASQLMGLAAAEWEVPSGCAGWRVREVVAHLVDLAEASQWTMFVNVARAGFSPDRALDRGARRIAAVPTAELIERLRSAADGRFHVLGSPSVVALGEVLVHSVDIFEPLGAVADTPVGLVVAVLPTYRRIARFAFRTKRISKVRMVATDADWNAGSGQLVEGTALDLLLALANRHDALARLSGPGVATLQPPAAA